MPDILLTAVVPKKAAEAPAYKEEKYADPIFASACSPTYGYLLPYVSNDHGKLPRFDIMAHPSSWDTAVGFGYDYLASVPNDAASRVAAMRAKIEEGRDWPSTNVDTLHSVSLGVMRQVGMEIGGLYQRAKDLAAKGDPSGWNQLASTVGVSTDAVKADYDSVHRILDTFSAGSVDFVQQLWSQIAPQILTVARSAADSIAKTFSATSTEMSSSLASAIPVIGPIVGVIIEAYTAWSDDLKRREAGACLQTIERTDRWLQKGLRLGMPPPIHLLDLYDVKTCSSGDTWYTPDQETAEVLARDNIYAYVGIGIAHDPPVPSSELAKYPGLPIHMQTQIAHWWNLAVAMMSHPDVGPVFRALMRDPFGGGIASDEQVMLVAAPIAVANGLDVDEFARLLWERSPGWRSRSDLAKPKVYYAPDPETGVWTVIVCKSDAGNAVQIQFGLLADTAFSLVDELRAKSSAPLAGMVRGGPRAVGAASEAVFAIAPKSDAEIAARGPMALPEAPPPTPTGVVLGALGSVGLYLAGAALPIAAVPLAVGATLYGLSKLADRPERVSRRFPPAWMDADR